MKANGTVFKYGGNVDTDVIIPARYLNIADKKELAELLMETPEEDAEGTGNDIQVYIGQENAIRTMKDCSIVTANYDLGNGMKGMIGIVGPKRMDYEKVMDNLKTLKSQMDSIFNKEE